MTLFGRASQNKHDVGQLLFFAGIVCIVLFLPFFFLTTIQNKVDVPKIIMLEVFVAILLIMWLIRQLARKEIEVRRTPIDKLLIGFLVLTGISTIISRAPLVSVFGYTHVFVLHAVIVGAFIAWWWLCLQSITTLGRWHAVINLMLIVTAVGGALFLLFQGDFAVRVWVPTLLPQVFTNTASMFANCMALGGILALGISLVRDRRVIHQILPYVTAMIAMATLIALDFTSAWVIFLVGAGMLLALGSIRLSGTHIASVSVVFIFFLLALWFLFQAPPHVIAPSLPPEISLGVRPSLDIAWQTLSSRPTTFLFGSGPGTFGYDFSLYRAAAFNLNQLVWTKRFTEPYSSLLAIVSELGVLGAIAFFSIILVTAGTAASVWRATRAVFTVHANPDTGLRQVTMEVGVVAAVWVAATMSLAISAAPMMLWWLWWTLLALLFTGYALIVTGIVHDRRTAYAVSPQSTLLVSFGLILLVAGCIASGDVLYRWYQAEVAHTVALQSADVQAQERYLKIAADQRPQYAPYTTALAKIYLERARELSSVQSATSTEIAAQYVQEAVNTAKRATEIDPYGIEAWETLSVMYLNARGFTAEANQWAMDTTKQAITLEPTNPLLYWRLGDTHRFNKQYAKAADAYRQAIGLKPDYLPAYIDLAEVFEAQENLTDAIAVFEPIFDRIQTEPDALFHLARLFYNRNDTGDSERAEQLWLHVVELQPNHSNALYSLGLLYERTGDIKQARSYIKRVQELNPDNEDIKAKLRTL